MELVEATFLSFQPVDPSPLTIVRRDVEQNSEPAVAILRRLDCCHNNIVTTILIAIPNMKAWCIIIVAFLWSSCTVHSFIPRGRSLSLRSMSAGAPGAILLDERHDFVSPRNKNQNHPRTNHHSRTILTAHRNTARTDVRNLLTQRAFQSFIDLLHNCRDAATVRWLEQTYGFQHLERFHGTAGIDLERFASWDDIFIHMLDQPADVIVVSAKRRGRGHGGWSKDNPYLEERFVEFEIDIDPPSLVARIISVRAQIAKDWTNDLKVLQHWNAKYLENPDLEFPTSTHFRTESMDLLLLLATQESIHRMLRLENRDDAYEGLRNYYISHVAEYFDGSQPFERYEAFLENLDDEIIAQDIIELRGMVLEEWGSVIEDTDHGDLQQVILAIRMGRTFDTSPTEERSIFTKAGADEEELEFFQ